MKNRPLKRAENKINCRKAKRDDWNSIKSIISLYPKVLMQNHLPGWNNFFVAEDNGKIVGCCALDIYSKRIAEVRSLAILPDYQEKRIGTELVELCLKRAKSKKILEVIAITGKEKMFNKLGFKTFNNEKMALLKIMQE